jgi:hypothetical protein
LEDVRVGVVQDYRRSPAADVVKGAGREFVSLSADEPSALELVLQRPTISSAELLALGRQHRRVLVEFVALNQAGRHSALPFRPVSFVVDTGNAMAGNDLVYLSTGGRVVRAKPDAALRVD